MSRSKGWTLDEVEAIYNEWLETDETDELFAEAYFLTGYRLKKLFAEFGFPVLHVKTRSCPQCGARFVASGPRSKFCSEKCCRTYNKESEKRTRALNRAEREKQIKERFPGYSAIVAINEEAALADMSYGQYVAKMGL